MTQRKTIPVRQLLLLIPLCFFAMYSGNIIGYLLQMIVSFLVPFFIIPQTAVATAKNPVLQALLVTFVSPFMEEVIFRKCVIDTLSPYGEKTALIASSLVFGLFHGTVNQLCYGFLLGLIFGYAYLKTDCLRYSFFLHALIHGISTVVLPILMGMAYRSAQGTDLQKVSIATVIMSPGVLLLLLFVIMLFVLFLFGAVLFFFGVREHDLSHDGIGMRTVFSSWGMMLFVCITGIALL